MRAWTRGRTIGEPKGMYGCQCPQHEVLPFGFGNDSRHNRFDKSVFHVCSLEYGLFLNATIPLRYILQQTQSTSLLVHSERDVFLCQS